MIILRTTARFARWLDHLRDSRGRSVIQARLDRLRRGQAGDVRWVGEGVLEMRIHSGPGYRVYFTRKGENLVILLAGGDKRSQKSDIRLAIELAREL